MDKYFWGVVIAVGGSLAVAAPIGLKYSQATMLFGLIAAICAPIVMHKISSKNHSIGMLVGLSIFASMPVKKLFGIDGFLLEVLVTAVYMILLWILGFGWKRRWS